MFRTDQLLSTKFYIPPPRPELVPRPRLIHRLDEVLRRRLTLISAPAGFGKTTLLSEWADGLRAQGAGTDPTYVGVAWLSLDANDNQPERFLAYLISALKQLDGLDPTFGESALGMLGSPQAPPSETILTSLINDFQQVPADVALILDDYHAIEETAVDSRLAFLLENLPSNLHVVIASRVDPSLPLPRLRARGEVTEVRAADLRFTTSEAAEFLNRVMGLELTSEEIVALENRTEGWIAGLQLAALSMQGREDIHGFIRSFTGDHRYIVDYLVEEVLERQPEHVRDFLLQTSILSRMNGPLCDAVTGREGSGELLKSLGQANLFIVPLDDRRYWYRYHHLFGDVLRVHLMQEQADQVPMLHQRACAWLEQNDLMSEAIGHAFAGQDLERAADLVETIWSEMDRSRQSARWLDWARKLPDEIVRDRPVLSVGYAWALLDRGELEAGEARLRDAERCLADGTADKVVVDEEEFCFLPATIASARSYHALAVGNVSGTVAFTRQALDLLPEDEYLRRGTPAALLSLASWTDGDLETADQALVNAMTSYRKAGNILYTVTGAYAIADIRITLGRIRQAFDICQQALKLAEGQADYVRWGMADVYSALAELYREMNDLEAAEENLSKGREFGERSQVPRWRYRWCLAQARLKDTQGRLDEALNLLEEAEENYRRGPMPDVRPVPALKARIWVRQGRLAEALDWVKGLGISPEDDLCFLREFDHITLARVLMAQYRQENINEFILSAISLLERLLKEAENGGRLGSVIEIRILQALAYEAQNDISAASESLDQALKLAEPEGYVRIFADEGAPMVRLLTEANSQGILLEYTRKLLDASKAGEAKGDSTASQLLIDPLSERELEILSLIANGLKNKEIAEQMVISLNTVLYHTKNIYNKLGVNKRTQAVLKARELNLL